MVSSGYISQGLPVGAAMFVRRILPAIVSASTFLLGLSVYGISLNVDYQAILIIIVLLTLIIVRTGPIDRNTIPNLWSSTISILGSWFVLFAIILVLGYATKTSSVYSRKLLFTWFLVTPVLIIVARFLIDRLIFRIFLSSGQVRKAVIAGANNLGQALAERMDSNPHFGLTVKGFFDDRGPERLDGLSESQILGGLPDLPEYVKTNNIDVVYLALPIRNIQRVSELIDQIHDTTASIYYVPDVFVFDLIQCKTNDIDGIPVIALCETPLHGTQGLVKRLSDIVISTSVLVLLCPLLLAIAIAVKLSMRGSVIFKQRRYGLDGSEIVVYKFRSMTVSEDSDVVQQAELGDPRVTGVGAFLRRYSLDELPQFINVLQGRMSVVGPRPHAVAHNEEYRKLIKGYMVRHKVSPGITGLAQVRGLRGRTETIDAMRQRVECDLEYLRNWSLALDMKIIFRTIAIVFADKSAY